MKNIKDYRITGNGLGHKGSKGVDKFKFAVMSIGMNSDMIMSKHITEKSAQRACRRYSKNSEYIFEVAAM